MNPQLSESEQRDKLADIYRRLVNAGMNSGTAGNVSCRFDDGLLISPTGATGDSIGADAVVSLTLDGKTRSPGAPSSEWRMHAEIYRRHPSAGAVIHTHADACTALSSLRRPIPAFHYQIAYFGGNEVPCASYATFGSRELALGAAEAMTRHTACLLANHGMICHATTLERALTTAMRLETVARQYWMALQGGEPVLLTEDEMAQVHARYGTYGTAKVSQ
jgi:L-fuculose-phosphate aldolase